MLFINVRKYNAALLDACSTSRLGLKKCITDYGLHSNKPTHEVLRWMKAHALDPSSYISRGASA